MNLFNYSDQGNAQKTAVKLRAMRTDKRFRVVCSPFPGEYAGRFLIAVVDGRNAVTAYVTKCPLPEARR